MIKHPSRVIYRLAFFALVIGAATIADLFSLQEWRISRIEKQLHSFEYRIKQLEKREN